VKIKLHLLFSMLIFNYIIRNTSFDGPKPVANRAIIPKNIKANKIMNFTASTSLIWTRYHLVHVFSVLRISGRPYERCSGWISFAWVFLERLHILINNKIWQSISALHRSNMTVYNFFSNPHSTTLTLMMALHKK
jgi:hypothetical protein